MKNIYLFIDDDFCALNFRDLKNSRFRDEHVIYFNIGFTQEDSKLLFKEIFSPLKVGYWFEKNAKNILNDEVPRFLENDYCIAQAINRKFEKSSAQEMDLIAEELFDYRSRHDLIFAFRGSNVQSVVLGRRNDVHTISLINGYEEPINLKRFFRS